MMTILLGVLVMGKPLSAETIAILSGMDTITGITIKNEQVWAGTLGTGLSQWDGIAWETYTMMNGLVDNTITTLATQDDTLWVGHFGNGISRQVGQVWQQYTTQDGLGGGYVSALAVTADNVVWAGHGVMGTMGQGGGLSRFDGNTWEFMDIPHESNAVTDLLTLPNGRLWVALAEFTTRFDHFAGGIAMFDGTEWQTFADFPAQSANSLAVDPHGRIWAGTPNGLLRWDGSMWTVVRAGDMTDVAIDRQGIVWAVADRQLIYFDGNEWFDYGLENIQTLEASQHIWVGSSNNIYQITLDDVPVHPNNFPSQLYLPMVGGE